MKGILFMHDIWNPWHGCIKCSEGCDNCYMYYLDKQRGRDGRNIYRTKSGAFYPLQKDKNGSYKIKSGEMIRVCMNSDFFLKEADEWRNDAWSVIKNRPDVKFFLLTKRPERVKACLPTDWGNGWNNVMFNVTCENQKRADERLPILLDLPFKHKGIMAAPFIGRLNVEQYLKTGQIEQVICGGENYDGARICNFDWVKELQTESVRNNITFCFIETGTVFVKDNKKYNILSKRVQAEMACKSGMYYNGKDIEWHLTDLLGNTLSENDLYKPYFSENCKLCGSGPICNGCSKCGKCKNGFKNSI